MSLVFESYWPLVFLAVIPWLWWVRGRSAVDLSPKHLTLSTYFRSALIVAIVLALMQPTILRTSSRISTVYLLDVSESVSPTSVQDALAWIRKTASAGGASDSKFVVFAANSLVFDNPADLAQVKVSSKPQPGAIDQSKT